MITKEDAMNLSIGTTLYHVTYNGSDNRPLRCRVNGKCKVWKNKIGEFRLPVKQGLRNCFYITEWNAVDWRKEEV
jgi:hypothetical protein